MLKGSVSSRHIFSVPLEVALSYLTVLPPSSGKMAPNARISSSCSCSISYQFVPPCRCFSLKQQLKLWLNKTKPLPWGNSVVNCDGSWDIYCMANSFQSLSICQGLRRVNCILFIKSLSRTRAFFSILLLQLYSLLSFLRPSFGHTFRGGRGSMLDS